MDTKRSTITSLLPVQRTRGAWHCLRGPAKVLAAEGATWVQIDEPILVLDLSDKQRAAFAKAYDALGKAGPKLLVTTYFGALRDNTELAAKLPVAGLHIDLVRASEQLDAVLAALPANKLLSVGVVDGATSGAPTSTRRRA